MNRELCILVDRMDKMIGQASKMACHKLTSQSELPLHRAFSLFLFDDQHRLLIQRRSSVKFTFPGMWSNTCCSHPLWSNGREEFVLDAAVRKTKHELGLDLRASDLVQQGSLIYSARSDGGEFGEHERTLGSESW